MCGKRLKIVAIIITNYIIHDVNPFDYDTNELFIFLNPMKVEPMCSSQSALPDQKKQYSIKKCWTKALEIHYAKTALMQMLLYNRDGILLTPFALPQKTGSQGKFGLINQIIMTMFLIQSDVKQHRLGA